jgi:Bifunctional DNA primase/polymerase, N-terminal
MNVSKAVLITSCKKQPRKPLGTRRRPEDGAARHTRPTRQDKAPSTSHGVHDATTEPEIMERWYRSYPAGALGTGRVSNVVALYLDSQEAITEALAEREHEDSDTAAALLPVYRSLASL